MLGMARRSDVAAGRRVQDEREARRFLRRGFGSGVSRRDWARARGIDGRSLHAWEMISHAGAGARRCGGRGAAAP